MKTYPQDDRQKDSTMGEKLLLTGVAVSGVVIGFRLIRLLITIPLLLGKKWQERK